MNGRPPLAHGERALRADGTADCEVCGLPRFPYAIEGASVRLECANRHHATARLPTDEGARRIVDAWIARTGAQLHAQHERWGTDEEDGTGEDGG